jgi:hypothetical protein
VIIDINPRRLEIRPGFAQQLTVTVTNTSDVIGGFTLRVLGADPGWVDAPEEPFSLFPDETRVLTLGIAVPAGIAAGERRIAIQVRELTPPEESAIEAVVLVVPRAPSLQLRADPPAVHAGRTGRFAILVDNTGNTTARGVFAAVDAERRTKVSFNPPTLDLAPGEHTVVDLKVTGRQPFLGSPLVRVLDLHLDDPDAPPPPAVVPAVPATPASGGKHRTRRRRKKEKPVVAERETPPLANATFVQKPVVGRGSISLLGLVAAMTVFAIVITIALSRIVGQSAADRNLALQIASAQNAADTSSGTSSVAGTVRLLTSGNGVGSIGVLIYSASDPSTPIATTSTSKNGTYSIGQLAAGEYKLTFRGAGFSQLWYPQAIDAADASTVTLEPNTAQRNLNVSLGGVPATLSGTVHGDDVSGATLTLRTADAGAAATSTTDGSSTGSASTAGSTGGSGSIAPALAHPPAPGIAPVADGAGDAVAPTPAGAVVKTLPIASDGTFELTGIPSPSVYQIDLTKDGYATSTQLIDVGAGEDRSGLNLTLLKGDGVVSGTVTAQGKALENATLTATSGQTSVSTATLDAKSGKAGTFTLRGLPTPASFTIAVAKAGYVTQTLAVQLSAGQAVTGLAITLDSASGGLQGSVKISGGGAAGGVAVTVTDGTDTIQTSTRSSGNVGAWNVSGLAVPGTYTVTFARSDLASNTVSVALDGNGTITSSSQGNGVTASSIAVTMRPATAVLSGTVKQTTSGSATTLGEATITVTSGTSTYTVTSATKPSSDRGTYRLAGLSPGTYSVSVSSAGVRPVSTTLTLTAGSTTTYSPVLQRAASISGHVYRAPCSASQTNCQAVPAGWVVELYRAADYPGTVYKTTVTGSGGSFSFIDLDAPESYLLQARSSVDSEAAGTTPSFALAGSEQRANVRLVVTTQ